MELSDFDSVKKVNPAIERCPEHLVKHKSLLNVNVLGTPEYRAAPEARFYSVTITVLLLFLSMCRGGQNLVIV